MIRSQTYRSKLLALQISIEGLEVCLRLPWRGRPVHPGRKNSSSTSFSLVASIELVDRQAHHARHVACADIAEVARWHGERFAARVFERVAWK